LLDAKYVQSVEPTPTTFCHSGKRNHKVFALPHFSKEMRNSNSHLKFSDFYMSANTVDN
jgi:hypothetical protein